MAYLCSECGKTHDELPRYFMWRAPETPQGKVIDVHYDGKTLCTSDRQCFIQCEVELPVLEETPAKVLGLICWVEIPRSEYERLLHYRKHEKSEPAYDAWIEGALANPVQGVPESYGTRVKFAVLKGDPTPYIKWAAPGSPLAARIEAGASKRFWHDVAHRYGGLK